VVREAFENVSDQIGGCGIWCGSCAVGNGALRELTDRFGAVLDSHGVGHWVPEEMDYPAFARGLATIREIAACVGCRQGGGRDDCLLRTCSVERKLADCTVCEEFGACSNDELLCRMREGAREAGLFVRDPSDPRAALLHGWKARVKTTWPSSILFAEDG
jgi:hypothetical protein